MTFLEAAIEVLRDVTEPLHYSEIARRAVEGNLLSHVGRDPEAAMKSCLTSAVRAGPSAMLERVKPGIYQVRPGAKLPDSPPRPPEKEDEDAPVAKKKTAKKATKKTAKKTAKKAAKKTTKKTAKKAAKVSSAKQAPSDPPDSNAPPVEDSGSASPDQTPDLAFEAPEGSGLDGVTDVALVMANAMSRLAHERPELREELEAMQSTDSGEDSAGSKVPAGPAATSSSAPMSDPKVVTKPTRTWVEGRVEKSPKRSVEVAVAVAVVAVPAGSIGPRVCRASVAWSVPSKMICLSTSPRP